MKQTVLQIYQEKYGGYGPTLAAEKLATEGYVLHHETLRLWLKEARIWFPTRKRCPYRQQRPRKEYFGQMLQLDGSPHHWFGEDQASCCLMDLVDDATGTTLALLAEQETTKAAMTLLKQWIQRYGIPGSVYVDLKTVYVSPKGLKPTEEQDGWTVGFTHFSKACEKLGIEIIKAYSPQAKGRVERKHGVYQDRFVKELKLQGIKTIKGGNHLLETGFIEDLNRKFAKQPQNPCDKHRSPEMYGDLDQIFCWEYTRQVQLDWTFPFKGHCFIRLKKRPLFW